MGANSFRDLIIWQKSHKLALSVFKMSKKTSKTSLNYEGTRLGN